jgi:Flp pilus assembly protein TadB
MHLHIGELLISAVYLAATVGVLVAIFRSAHNRHQTRARHEFPPVKQVERKRDGKKDNDKRDAA